jgi:hypothetical protein
VKDKQNCLTSKEESFDIFKKSIESIDVSELKFKSSFVKSVNNDIDDGNSTISDLLNDNRCSQVHIVRSIEQVDATLEI